MSKPTVNGFFCGCGGMDLGFKQAGYKIAGAWDYDKYAVQTYRHNVDGVCYQADIRDMFEWDIPRADVWTFGFPCQDISNEGQKAGLEEGTRSGLFFEVMRLLDEIPLKEKPKVIMAENVRRLKRYLPVLEEHYEKHGYKMYYVLYNSWDADVAQNRNRYYVIGVRKDILKSFKFPVLTRPSRKVLLDSLDKNVPERYYLSKLPKTCEWTDEGSLKMYEPTKLGHVIAVIGDGLDTARPGSKNRRGRLGRERVQTLTTSGRVHIIIDPETKRARWLTPNEFGRLQGFPIDDGWEQVVSDTQAYKQFGNAVTVNVAKVLAEAIYEQILKED